VTPFPHLPSLEILTEAEGVDAGTEKACVLDVRAVEAFLVEVHFVDVLIEDVRTAGVCVLEAFFVDAHFIEIRAEVAALLQLPYLDWHPVLQYAFELPLSRSTFVCKVPCLTYQYPYWEQQFPKTSCRISKCNPRLQRVLELTGLLTSVGAAADVATLPTKIQLCRKQDWQSQVGRLLKISCCATKGKDSFK